MTAKAQSLLVQAQKTLLTPYGLDVADLNKVFASIMTHDVDYADLYFQYSRSEAWSLEEGIVKSGSFNIDEGFGARAISGEKTAFAYSDDISPLALGDAATTVPFVTVDPFSVASVSAYPLIAACAFSSS